MFFIKSQQDNYEVFVGESTNAPNHSLANVDVVLVYAYLVSWKMSDIIRSKTLKEIAEIL